ncbi:MAG: hypothetical protein LBF68_07065 [Christensenellaceae bacterium]|jgi:hypothetical protein|nr:hypothetical protein [Christensenellaceae bacterium]
MYIEVLDPKKNPRLRLTDSKRIKGKSGKISTHKFVVLYLGLLSKYDDGEPDYLERLRESFKAGRPLIPALEPYCTIDPDYGINFNYMFDYGDPICLSKNKHCSNILLDCILDELGLPVVFANCKNLTKIEYDVYGFFKLLVFDRILGPASNFSTVLQNDSYYAPILDDHNPDNVYDTLAFIDRFKKQIIQMINSNLVANGGRSKEYTYYSITDFHFEADEPDEDVLDDYGIVTDSDMSKICVSKEERPQPTFQVEREQSTFQIGLFIDNDGLPISVESFSGNAVDHLSMKHSLRNTIDDLDSSRFILIVHQCRLVYSDLVRIIDSGNGYIASNSLLMSSADELKWAYSDNGYIHISNSFKYKSRIIERVVLDEKKNERVIKEKVLVYWSETDAKKSIAEWEWYFRLLDKFSTSTKSFDVSRSEVKSIKRFLCKDILNSNTDELFKSTDLKKLIDRNKIKEYKRNFGFYQIITSEIDMDEQKLIERSRRLADADNQFQVMRETLETCPGFIKGGYYTEANSLISMIAQLLICIIQKKIREFNSTIKNKSKKREPFNIEMSAEKIQIALSSWQVEKLPSEEYRFTNYTVGDIKIILDAFNIDIPIKLHSDDSIKEIKSLINVFK